MPEQHLNNADIDILLQEMGGEAVAQGVRADLFADAGDLGVHGGVGAGAVLEAERGEDGVLLLRVPQSGDERSGRVGALLEQEARLGEAAG